MLKHANSTNFVKFDGCKGTNLESRRLLFHIAGLLLTYRMSIGFMIKYIPEKRK